MPIPSPLIIRQATECDLPDLARIFDDARSHQRRSGFTQWADDYPPARVLQSDIESGHAYVIATKESRAEGYFYLAFNDPGYDGTGVAWRYDGPFAVVHRLALSSALRGCGYASAILNYAHKIASSSGAEAMRVDTGEANRCMQHLLARLGYEAVGLVDFIWGPLLAYEIHL